MDTNPLIEPYRRSRVPDTIQELAGSLEAPNHPELSTGYADIYHGFWRNLQGEQFEVAIKEFKIIIPRSKQTDPEALKRRTEIRIKREAFLWSQTTHKNLHPLIGYRSQPKPRLISPWCRHGNLKDYLRENPSLSRLDKLQLIHQAGCGLDHLHSQMPPICHADIKPENVLINDRFEAVLSDFGLSRLLQDLGDAEDIESTEGVRGTLNYTAAEVFSGEKPGRETDVYAFGGLILTVMSGRAPFKGASGAHILFRVMYNRPPGPEEHPELPPSDFLWGIMRSCWDKAPTARPPMSEVLRQIHLCYQGCSSLSRTNIMIVGGDGESNYPKMDLDVVAMSNVPEKSF